MKKIIVIIILIIITTFAVVLGYFKYMSSKRGTYVKDDFEYFLYSNSVVIVKYNGNNEEVVIPDEILSRPITEIGDKCFKGNVSLKKIYIPQTVKKIGDRAFEDCNMLENVELPSEITQIGRYAFYNCCSIKKIEMPPNIDEERECIIGGCAFDSCSELTTIDFNNSYITVGDWAFANCVELNTILNFKNINACCESFDNTGILNNFEDEDFFYLGDYLIKYLGDDPVVHIPDFINKINPYSFNVYYNDVPTIKIESIYIPRSINSLILYFNDSYIEENGKVKLFFDDIDEFTVPSVAWGDDWGNYVIIIAPEGSAVIEYAKENDIEYIIEE